MSRIAPLFKVESFRGSMSDVMALGDEELAELRALGVGEVTTGVSGNSLSSDLELKRKAFGLLYEAAVRDGVDEVEEELRAAFPEAESSQIQRLIAAVKPSADDELRFGGIDERDGYLPILVSHRLALDLRVTESEDGAAVATPFVTVRLEFDTNVAPGIGAVVFQLNLADIEGFSAAVSDVYARARRLIAGNGTMSIPEWGHGLSG